MTISVLYLHGFASSPGSTKARLFGEKFAAHPNVHYAVPDLNVPDFEHLTLTAMIERTAEAVHDCPDGPVYLVGSSMGGLTAVQFMDRHRGEAADRVAGLMLLAPAFDFMANRQAALGENGLERWRESGYLPVFNYAVGGESRVHYGLAEDIQRYEPYDLHIDAPVVIFHGRNDESVDYQQSVRFAEGRPNVTLHLVDSDHQLLDQTEAIWMSLNAFLSL